MTAQIHRRRPTARREAGLGRVVRQWRKLCPGVRASILQIVDAAINPENADACTALSELILSAAEDIDPAFPLAGGPMVCFSRLRLHATLLPVSKAAFDRAVVFLARTSPAVCVHHHDHAARLTEAARDDLVTDGQDGFFIGLSTK